MQTKGNSNTVCNLGCYGISLRFLHEFKKGFFILAAACCAANLLREPGERRPWRQRVSAQPTATREEAGVAVIDGGGDQWPRGVPPAGPIAGGGGRAQAGRLLLCSRVRLSSSGGFSSLAFLGDARWRRSTGGVLEVLLSKASVCVREREKKFQGAREAF